MTDVTAAEAPPKTLGDYAVDAEKAMASNNTAGLAPVIAEMRAAVPPEPAPVEGAPAAEPPPPPPPADLGLKGFADALDSARQQNNVVLARKVAEDMKTIEPPTADPAAAQVQQQPAV